MRVNKAFSLVYWTIFSALSVGIFIALLGFFKAAEHSSSGLQSENRLLTHLKIFYQQLKEADSPELAKKHFKSFETTAGFSADSTQDEYVKKVFNPILVVFAEKPKEADAKFLLSKKKDLMENLVNAYRKEIPNGDIALRATYLNILFDSQASLLNETDEAEEVFIKRNSERFATLKGMANNARDTSKTIRISNLDSIFSSYQRGFEAAAKWRKQKESVLTKIDKSIPGLAKQLYAEDNQSISETRRSFLYTAIISLLLIFGSLCALLIGQKFNRLKFESSLDAVALFLKDFGLDKPHDEKALTELRADEDWNSLLNKILKIESDFVLSTQTQLSVPRSMRLPYLVFSKEKNLVLANDSAKDFLKIGEEKVDFYSIFNEERIAVREGELALVIEMIRASFSNIQEESFGLMMPNEGKWLPVEVIFSPITAGHLIGGKIVLFRIITNEVERIEKSVSTQLSRVRDYLQKITKFKPVDLVIEDRDLLPVREAILDLQALKLSLEERESLWKNETSALCEQVDRQKDILLRLTSGIESMRESHAELRSLLESIHGGDEHWHDEVCVIERDLARWIESRQRLSQEINNYDSVVMRAKEIEQQIRISSDQMKNSVFSFEKEFQDLKRFCEEAKVHAINLSFIENPEQREYAARSRAFSKNLELYTHSISDILIKLKEFLAKHPGTAIFPQLDTAKMDASILENLKQEQLQWSQFLQRWKSAGQQILEGGARAIDIIHQVDKSGHIAMQLGETSLIINDQAKNNIERWV